MFLISGRFFTVLIFIESNYFLWASLLTQLVKNPPAMQETRFNSWVEKIPGEGIGYPLHYSWDSLVTLMVKNLPAVRRPGFDCWVGKIP